MLLISRARDLATWTSGSSCLKCLAKSFPGFLCLPILFGTMVMMTESVVPRPPGSGRDPIIVVVV